MLLRRHISPRIGAEVPDLDRRFISVLGGFVALAIIWILLSAVGALSAWALDDLQFQPMSPIEQPQ